MFTALFAYEQSWTSLIDFSQSYLVYQAQEQQRTLHEINICRARNKSRVPYPHKLIIIIRLVRRSQYNCGGQVMFNFDSAERAFIFKYTQRLCIAVGLSIKRNKFLALPQLRRRSPIKYLFSLSLRYTHIHTEQESASHQAAHISFYIGDCENQQLFLCSNILTWMMAHT